MSLPSPYALACRWHEISRRLKVRGIRDAPLDAAARQKLEAEAADIAAVLAGLPGEPEQMTNFFVEVRGHHTDATRRCFAQLEAKELQPHEAQSYLLHHDPDGVQVAEWLYARGYTLLEGLVEHRGWLVRVFVTLDEIDGLLTAFWADWSTQRASRLRPFVAVLPAPREVRRAEEYDDEWP